ncbi:FecR family protein [Sphingobium ummariense]|uniref:FecR protein domain-containing protein n=1 Tax=Sphingobium ummariense RL-3 TaxID=1346791 RepID=T0ILV1_9SPHN|nr:FecR domain-containing protein [Sphingobium ummariense]EQB29815.1 hypothetical protein M529_23840 [Sphingobium ummariense RL-3]
MIARRDQPPPDPPQEAAIWWATCRQLDPDWFAADERFEVWLDDPANSEAWHAIDRRIEQVGAFATMPEVREMRRAALELARVRKRSIGPRWALGTALAASVLAAIGLGSLTLSPRAVPDIATVDNVQRFATAIGQRRDILLDDGSKVTLNTDSLVEVRYSADRRDVRLLQGEAMFHVAKNTARPFIVSAQSRQVTALGTAFDVRIRQDGHIQVLLVEGKVRVEPVRHNGLGRIIPALDRTELSPGQQLIAEGQGEVEVVAADVERETAWNRGALIFRGDSLGDAVEEVNRYSAMPLMVDDPTIARLKVSGIFPTANQADFVAALEALYPVRAHKEEGGTIRLTWRERLDRQPD